MTLRDLKLKIVLTLFTLSDKLKDLAWKLAEKWHLEDTLYDALSSEYDYDDYDYEYEYEEE